VAVFDLVDSIRAVVDATMGLVIQIRGNVQTSAAVSVLNVDMHVSQSVTVLGRHVQRYHVKQWFYERANAGNGQKKQLVERLHRIHFALRWFVWIAIINVLPWTVIDGLLKLWVFRFTVTHSPVQCRLQSKVNLHPCTRISWHLLQDTI
jgi:hypothetical protein